jgi:hypothetical protein
MARGKRFSPEQIIAKLRQIEGQRAQGKSLALACKEAGISEQNSGTRADRLVPGSRACYSVSV